MFFLRSKVDNACGVLSWGSGMWELAVHQPCAVAALQGKSVEEQAGVFLQSISLCWADISIVTFAGVGSTFCLKARQIYRIFLFAIFEVFEGRRNLAYGSLVFFVLDL